MRTLALTLLVALTGLAGCLSGDETSGPTDDVPDTGIVTDPLVALPAPVLAAYLESIVSPAVGYAQDLYEPTMEVSDAGAIYVTGHTIGVDTTGAPVFASFDDGQTWQQMPFTQTLTAPEPLHGATPPVTDEIFLIAGEDGYLYGVDITAAAFPVNAWRDRGGVTVDTNADVVDVPQHTYYNPNAYDRAETGITAASDWCNPVASLNDRPWGAYADGHLLMVNNPGGGPMQIGVMNAPMALPVGAPGSPVVGPEWNLCASTGGGIPGVPDMRQDHFFAVPQTEGNHLNVVTGYTDDIFATKQHRVFNVTSFGGGTSNGGRVSFDAEGTMFVAIRNNTQVRNETGAAVFGVGQIRLAVSLDDGETFVEGIFQPGNRTTSVYLDGNMYGPGALLAWSQIGEAGTDWYVAHLFADPVTGAPVVENVMLVLKDGPPTSAHVQGAAVGPDGRAHIVTFHGGYTPTMGTPLHVWIQQDGPTLPKLFDTPVF